ncbi:putative acyl-CoA transferase/carnitine dehydratase [Sphingobium yanoikuyae]|uniref:Putative acyl-CoA transferase/carnitine dehydratase n=1 Tax=Sphingobium yanoikuyae TaxID=13690 RepID=A0A084EP15_SPHYA|nr:CoA transferase [Sphingobium yanoikuyae]KEZ19707.1 putative acyl-CoA transferase/carnitine dehydratase [Sphingobium yanoikuyae]
MALALPLAGWAEAQLEAIRVLAGTPALAGLSGAQLLGERAALNGFAIPGRRSAGGGCRLYDAIDGQVALTLARADDRDLMPALFGDAGIESDSDIVTGFATAQTNAIVTQGRQLGLAIAAIDEVPASPACRVMMTGGPRPIRDRPPLVIDLSALWAGPLAGHLLGLAGAQVIKVESRNRPDRMRAGDPLLFARLNQHKANVAIDLRDAEDRAALIALIRRADMVVAAARPRALAQLGIDADALVREVPGLVWVTITGHGADGDAAHWIGFGDDCSVAGGLSAALQQASGRIGFGGDACADPMTGLHAAHRALAQWHEGMGAHLLLSMSAVVAEAIDWERARDAAGFTATLQRWAEAEGAPFPAMAARTTGPVPALGQDNGAWLC